MTTVNQPETKRFVFHANGMAVNLQRDDPNGADVGRPTQLTKPAPAMTAGQCLALIRWLMASVKVE
jgi:hypothetical protein